MTTDTIRTTIADAALAGVTDDPDVTTGVAAVEPSATLAACQTNGCLLDFEDHAAVRGGGGRMNPITVYRIRTDTRTFQTTDADTAETYVRAGDRVTAVTTADP